MSFDERNTVAEILTNLVIVVLFAGVIYTRYEAGTFDGPDGLKLWARTVLWLIPAAIVAGIVITVVITIIHAIITREKHYDRSDERDRMISGYGWRVTMITVAVGFVGGLIALAIGFSPLYALNLMLAGFALGDTAGNVTRLYFYRRGF